MSDIPNEYIDLMKILTRETKKDNLERGFSVCKTNDGYKTLEICTGDRNCVDIEKCDWGTMFLQFHTHPVHANRLLSEADVVVVLAEDPDYFCVGLSVRGQKRNGVIGCYKVNKEKDRYKMKSSERDAMIAEIARNRELRQGGRSFGALINSNVKMIKGDSDIMNKIFDIDVDKRGE